MISKYTFLTLVLMLFSSCKNDFLGEKSTILLNSEHNKWLKSNYGYQTWIPTKKDLEIVDKVLEKAIENNEFDFIKDPVKENIDKYPYKQYIPYLDNNGDRIIYLNTFCLPPEEQVFEINGEYEWKKFDWKNEYYKVDDGGFCYWSIIINIDKVEYSNFMVNGP